MTSVRLALVLLPPDPRRSDDGRRARPPQRAASERAPEALHGRAGREWQGLGAASDFVFTSETGRPLGRERIAKRGVTRAATQAGLGHVTPQVLRRSVATLTAHARVPTVIAAAMTGHSPRVYDEHYAKPFRDAEERKRIRVSLASVGLGSVTVDQSVDQRAAS